MWNWLIAIPNRFFTFMASLVIDGGPSVTRYAYLRTLEIVSAGWFLLVLATIWRYLRFGTTDGGMLGLIGSILVPLLGASAINQNTKLTADAAKITPSTLETPTGKVTQGISAPANEVVQTEKEGWK